MRRLLAAGLLLTAALTARSSQAAEFVLMPGFNFSSPRTALSDPVSFIGPTVGAGVNFTLYGNARASIEVDYLIRRFGGFANVPTLMFPAIIRFENKYLILGAGPYLAVTLGISSDDGQPATVGNMSVLDYGAITEFAIKLPLDRKVTVLLDVRALRALNASYQAPEVFYWTQVLGFVGFQIKIGKASRPQNTGNYNH